MDFGVTRRYYHPTREGCLVVQVSGRWYEFADRCTGVPGWSRRVRYRGRRHPLEQLAASAEIRARATHRIPLP